MDYRLFGAGKEVLISYVEGDPARIQPSLGEQSFEQRLLLRMETITPRPAERSGAKGFLFITREGELDRTGRRAWKAGILHLLEPKNLTTGDAHAASPLLQPGVLSTLLFESRSEILFCGMLTSDPNFGVQRCQCSAKNATPGPPVDQNPDLWQNQADTRKSVRERIQQSPTGRRPDFLSL